MAVILESYQIPGTAGVVPPILLVPGAAEGEPPASGACTVVRADLIRSSKVIRLVCYTHIGANQVNLDASGCPQQAANGMPGWVEVEELILDLTTYPAVSGALPQGWTLFDQGIGLFEAALMTIQNLKYAGVQVLTPH